MKAWVFDSQYIGSVYYFKALYDSPKALIDLGENFIKSTYRNRCYIPGPNNILLLSIPLRQGKSQKKPMSKVEISYDHPWQKLHWKTFCSCYQSAPYFEYYENDFRELIFKDFKYLTQLNMAILKWINEVLGLEIIIDYSNEYINSNHSSLTDMRSRFEPKRLLKDPYQNNIPSYMQVFDDKIGFKENMSILDLVFNEGPNTVSYLLN